MDIYIHVCLRHQNDFVNWQLVGTLAWLSPYKRKSCKMNTCEIVFFLFVLSSVTVFGSSAQTKSLLLHAARCSAKDNV